MCLYETTERKNLRKRTAAYLVPVPGITQQFRFFGVCYVRINRRGRKHRYRLRMTQQEEETSISMLRLCHISGYSTYRDSLDKLMHFLPQLSHYVPLRNGFFYSFRAQTA